MDKIRIQMHRKGQMHKTRLLTLQDFYKLTVDDLKDYKDTTINIVVDRDGNSCYKAVYSLGLKQFESLFCREDECLLDKKVVDIITNYNTIKVKYGTLNDKSIALKPFNIYSTSTSDRYLYLGKVEITKSIGYMVDDVFNCVDSAIATKHMRLKCVAGVYDDFLRVPEFTKRFLSKFSVIEEFVCKSAPKIKERTILGITEFDKTILPTETIHKEKYFSDSRITTVYLDYNTLISKCVQHEMVVKYKFKYLDMKK